MQVKPSDAELARTIANGIPEAEAELRLLAVEPQGGERLIGDFTFNHTRTIPGPPAWE